MRSRKEEIYNVAYFLPLYVDLLFKHSSRNRTTTKEQQIQKARNQHVPFPNLISLICYIRTISNFAHDRIHWCFYIALH